MSKRRVVKSKGSSLRHKAAARRILPVRAVRSRPSKWEAAAQEELRFEEPPAAPPLEWVEVQCPHCGEPMDIRVDPSGEGQVLTQDCAVCCKPIELAVEVEEGEVSVSTSRG